MRARLKSLAKLTIISKPEPSAVRMFKADAGRRLAEEIGSDTRSRRDPQRDRYQCASAPLRPDAVNNLGQRVALHELARAPVGLLLGLCPLLARPAARFAPLGLAAAQPLP